MSYKIETETFDAEFKRLAKKCTSLKTEVAKLANNLAENPAMETPIGKSCYKKIIHQK